MAYNFEDREKASKAGKKSKRGLSKLQKEMKELIFDVTNKNFKTLQKDLDKLKKDDIEKYFRVQTKLMEFILSKGIDITSDGEKIGILTDVREKLAEKLSTGEK